MKSFGKHGLPFGRQVMKTGFDKQAIKTLGKQSIKNFGKDTFQLGKKPFVDKKYYYNVITTQRYTIAE
jgi:hypothetical protein